MRHSNVPFFMGEIMQFFNELYQQLPILYYIYIFLIGLMVGSFLNVVIYRLPVMMERAFKRDYLEYFDPDNEELRKKQERFNLMVPRSRCPKCGHMITAWENIPVLSWIILGGKCHKCKLPISFRYPAIESLSGILTLISAFILPPSWQLLGSFIIIWSFIALSFIDFDKMLLPDEMTLPLIWLGLIFNYFGIFVELHDALIGAVVGYLFLWSFYWIFKLCTGKEGMGYGDFKLMSLIGAWFGWQVLPASIMLSALAGAIVGIPYLILTNKGKSRPLPFGPYIAIAGIVVMWWGTDINNWYLHDILHL